jgi:hypothetical protein
VTEPPLSALCARVATQFMKRAFSVEALLEPLPGPLKTSLSRNFGFFKRIFTQFTDPNEKKNIAKSIPGAGK